MSATDETRNVLLGDDKKCQKERRKNTFLNSPMVKSIKFVNYFFERFKVTTSIAKTNETVKSHDLIG